VKENDSIGVCLSSCTVSVHVGLIIVKWFIAFFAEYVKTTVEESHTSHNKVKFSSRGPKPGPNIQVR